MVDFNLYASTVFEYQHRRVIVVEAVDDVIVKLGLQPLEEVVQEEHVGRSAVAVRLSPSAAVNLLKNYSKSPS